MSVKPIKQGLSFNGLTDYVSVPDSPLFRGFSAFTISTRISNLVNADTGIVSKWSTTIGREYLFGLIPTGFQFVVKLAGGSYSVAISYTPSANTDEITGVYDGSNLILYVNGVEAGRTTGLTGVVDSGIQPLEIGRHDGAKYTKGKVSNVRIYNRSLAPAEVTANYNGQVARNGLVGEWLFNDGTGTVATDTSGNNNHGTINGATWVIEKKPKYPKKNLFDESSWTMRTVESGKDVLRFNGYYTITTGVIAGNPLVLSSNAKPNTTYTFSGRLKKTTYYNNVVVFYTDNTMESKGGSVDNYGNTNITFTTSNKPVKVIYIDSGASAADGYADLNSIQLEESATATTYELYQLINDAKPSKKKPKKNMYNDATLVVGISLNLNGTTGANALFGTSDYIPVQPNTTYTKSTLNGYEFYDSGKNFVIGDAAGTMVSPPTASYMRINIPLANRSTYQLEQGSSATAYEQYIPLNDLKLLPLVPKKNMFDYLNTPIQALNSNETLTKTAPYVDLTVPSGSYGVVLNTNIPVQRNTDYVVSCNSAVLSGTPGAYGLRIHWVNNDTYSGINSSVLSFNSGANDYIQVLLYAGLPTNNNVTVRFSNIQLEQGTVATPYEVYQLVGNVKRVT